MKNIVFAPKYRRKVIYKQIRKGIGEIFRKLCNEMKVEIIEAEACVDHIHMLVSIDRYKALPKESTAENHDIRRIAKFLNLDSEHEMLNSNGFITDSRMLENTIKLFMTDVVNMQEAHLAREQEKEKQRAETRGKGMNEKKNVDLTIAKAEALLSKKTMKRYE